MATVALEPILEALELAPEGHETFKNPARYW